jgi:hypothetical protein
MKKFLSIFSIALLAMFAASCGTDEPTDDSKNGITFNIAESNISSSSIEVVITPSDMTANYYADIVATADIEGMNDAELIDEWVVSGEHTVRKGVKPVSKSGLQANTSYTVVAFAVTETEKATRKEFTTAEAVAALPADQFNITIDVKDITATSAVVTVTPNGSNRYYFRVIPKMELDAWNIYGNDYETFSYICENPNSGDYITSGTQNKTWTIHPEMDYVAIAFNYENWKEVYEKVADVKLFTYEFKTPEAPAVDPNSLFLTGNLKTYNTAFSLDVTPVRGEDAHWTYYVWTKASYDETLANEPKNNIVMRSCFGLNNIAVAQGYDFGTIIKTDKLGKVGSNTITSYETLRPNTDYVVVMFYVDPTNSDPTEIYDYNFVAVEFKTVEASSAAPVLEVSEPIIESSGFAGYNVSFNIKVDESTVLLSKGANLWNDDQFGKYWDPSDWNTIRAFCWLYPVNDETLAQAKTDTGCVISFSSEGVADYVFFFEAENAEGTRTQHVVRVTPEMYENVE